MPRVYKYKRVGARKLALTLSIASAVILSLFLISIPQIDTVSIIISFMMVCCCSILLYYAYRKNYASVEDGVLKIVGTMIPAKKMKKIDVNEKRIDIIVEKGTFLLGTRIYMTDTCFYSTTDWDDFKQDIENLKTLVNQ